MAHPRPGEAQLKALQATQQAHSERHPPTQAIPALHSEDAKARRPGVRGRILGNPLPDGATFSARYEAASGCFRATLTLLCGKTFVTRGGGVFAAVRQLYAEYYSWIDAGSPSDHQT